MKGVDQLVEKIKQLVIAQADPSEVQQTLDEIGRIIERRKLKRNVIEELEKRDGRSNWSEILRHPLFITLVGFAATGILGGLFSSCIQKSEWMFQQAHQAYQHKVDTKYGLVNEVSNSVAASLTAAEDVLVMLETPYTGNDASAELEIRKRLWTESSRVWRVASATIEPRLSAYFGSPIIDRLFDTLCIKRKLVGNKVTVILAYLASDFEHEQDDSTRLNITRKWLGEAKEQLRQLTAKMIELIHRDEQESMTWSSLVLPSQRSLRGNVSFLDVRRITPPSTPQKQELHLPQLESSFKST